MRRLLTGGLVIGVVLIGVGVFTSNSSAAPADASSAAAQASCDGIARLAAGRGRVDRLAGAFVTTAADLTAWQETRYGRQAQGPRVVDSMWTRMPGRASLTVCFFDGEFAGISRPTRLRGQTYDRLVMAIDESGQAFIETVGFRATTPAEKPIRKR